MNKPITEAEAPYYSASTRRLLVERKQLLGIVQRLANREPYYVDNDDEPHICAICRKALHKPSDEQSHAEDCPYRLAVEYIENAAGKPSPNSDKGEKSK